ncbi:MAG: class I SAM-dependent methyltransferase, partial [Proteobacteria bacterium]|nr:class I SAM-dependent methyltransferase [Pseudomonadota bacterium]
MNAKREEKSLAECYSEHRGKVSDKWSSYLEIYQRAFEPYRQMPVRLLEIGIQNGGSLEIWAKYFSNATAIVGCDINPACSQLRYTDERIHVVVDDANTEGAELSIAAYSPCFDIIIDDVSHRSSDIVLSFDRYFPRLELGGVFIAEDLHCSYWREFEGGLIDP